jgi:NAD(P)-dependent dehydrogenase (short-subunit alcohol dehydrogenase family)
VEAVVEELGQSRGSIVSISSICGLEVVPNAPITYSVAKAALNAYVRGISRPLGKRGIRINAIAPGNIFFEGSVWEKRITEDGGAVANMLNQDVALGKLGSPRDIANLTAYLLSDVSSFATGGIWTLDGGQVHS